MTGLFDGARWQCALGVERLKFDDPETSARLGEIVTFSVTKSNYAVKPDPIVLRRDEDNGGALLAVGDEDLETIDAARTDQILRTPKAAARKVQCDERECREDIAVLEAVRERPGLTARKLRDPVKAKAKCGSPRADVAITRARKWLDIRPSKLRDAAGEPVDTFWPPDDEGRLPEHLR